MNSVALSAFDLRSLFSAVIVDGSRLPDHFTRGLLAPDRPEEGDDFRVTGTKLQRRLPLVGAGIDGPAPRDEQAKHLKVPILGRGVHRRVPANSADVHIQVSSKRFFDAVQVAE